MGGDGGWPERLRAAIASRESRRVPDEECEARAAVLLLVRRARDPGPGQPEALFVRRAEVDDDPWSGHTALPGGRSEPGDADLVDTALRETREETGLRLGREAVIGRLDELHPRSRHLPSIAVTPFVAWAEAPPPVRTNRELTGHLWVPLGRLTDVNRRSVVRRAEPTPREFPAIEVEGHVIWGLTFVIVEDLLRRLGPG